MFRPFSVSRCWHTLGILPVLLGASHAVQAQSKTAPAKPAPAAAASSFAKESERLEKALKTATPAKIASVKASLANIYVIWSLSLIEHRDYEGALDKRKKALELDRTSRPKMAVQHWLYLDPIYRELEQSDNAGHADEEAIKLAHQLKDNRGEATGRLQKGELLRLNGQLGPALGTFGTVLPLAKGNENQDLQIRALSGAALVQSDLEQFTPALEGLSQALRMARARKNKAEQADILASLGSVFSAKEQLVDALRYYRASLALFQELKNSSAQLSVLNNIGTVYHQLRRFDEEETLYKTGLPLARKLGDRRTEGYLQEGLAIIDMRRDRIDRAVPQLQAALRLKSSSGDQAGLVTTYGNLMSCQKALGNLALAIFYGKSAIEITERERAGLTSLPEEVRRAYLDSITRFYRDLADLLVAEDRLIEAEQVLQLLKNQEYREFTRDAKTSDAAIVRDEREQKAQSQESALSADVLSLARERVSLEVSGSDPARLKTVTDQLAIANTKYQTFLKELPTLFATKVDDGDSDEKIAEQLKNFQKQRALLKKSPDTVALYTVVAPQRYSVILFSANATVAYSTDISAQAIKEKILAFRMALQDDTIDPRPLGQELYDILFCNGKVENELKKYDAKTLLWSLDGALRLIPPGALFDGTDYLARRYSSATLTREGIIAPAESNHNWRVLGLGATKDATVKAVQINRGERDYYFEPLPGVKTELEALVRENGEATGLLAGQRKIDSEFSRADLLKDLRSGDGAEGRFPVVHIASHFHCGATPEESFLLLGDGTVLTLADLSAEGITSQLFEDVDLLTLSACATGLSTSDPGTVGREVDTLGSVAQEQGAHSVLVSLWPISDAGTPELMRSFYSLRTQHPDWTKAQLLQAAQMALLDGKTTTPASGAGERGFVRTTPQGTAIKEAPAFKADPNAPFSHPKYWATFILLGSWQ